MGVIFVYVTNPNRRTAKRIATHMLKKKLIACANIFPIDSVYWWEGKIEETKEFVLIIKSSSENWRKIKDDIKKIHPYSIPCIIRINIEANKKFGDWLRNVVKESV